MWLGKKKSSFEFNYRTIHVYKQCKATDAQAETARGVCTNALTNRCRTHQNSPRFQIFSFLTRALLFFSLFLIITWQYGSWLKKWITTLWTKQLVRFRNVTHTQCCCMKCVREAATCCTVVSCLYHRVHFLAIHLNLIYFRNRPSFTQFKQVICNSFEKLFSISFKLRCLSSYNFLFIS